MSVSHYWTIFKFKNRFIFVEITKKNFVCKQAEKFQKRDKFFSKIRRKRKRIASENKNLHYLWCCSAWFYNLWQMRSQLGSLFATWVKFTFVMGQLCDLNVDIYWCDHKGVKRLQGHYSCWMSLATTFEKKIDLILTQEMENIVILTNLNFFIP